MEERQVLKPHKINMNNRKEASISGVKDVLSFDAKEILLETELGMLMIKGDNLHVTKLTLDKGEVEVDGTIDSLQYSNMSGKQQEGEAFYLVCLNRGATYGSSGGGRATTVWD